MSDHLRGGVDGNERLTGANAVVLLVLLAAEGATIPFVRQSLTLHIFLGLLLVPPVLLKLASTGWRFARYYLKDAEYLTARATARVPPVARCTTDRGVDHRVVRYGASHSSSSTRATGWIIGLHKASFVVWFGCDGRARPRHTS